MKDKVTYINCWQSMCLNRDAAERQRWRQDTRSDDRRRRWNGGEFMCSIKKMRWWFNLQSVSRRSWNSRVCITAGWQLVSVTSCLQHLGTVSTLGVPALCRLYSVCPQSVLWSILQHLLCSVDLFYLTYLVYIFLYPSVACTSQCLLDSLHTHCVL